MAISYNGEIYNFRELRAELEASGHAFPHRKRHRGDPRGLAAHGGRIASAASHGMFAFALYDAGQDCAVPRPRPARREAALLAPLPDGGLAFASELKGLLAHPLLRRSPSLQAVEDYLAFGYVPDDAAHRRRASPSSRPAIICSSGAAARCRRRRSAGGTSYFSDPQARPLKALEEEMVERLRAAVRSRMVADVPLGAFLSGGVDSSAVVAFMAEASRSAVETCSIGFDEADHDERAHAARIAELFATDHHRAHRRAEDFGLIDTLAAAFDEPFADASALATYRVCRAGRARRSRSPCRATAPTRRWPAIAATACSETRSGSAAHCRSRWARALGRLGDAYPTLDWAPQWLRAKTILQALGQGSGEAYARAVGVTPPEIRHAIYGGDFAARCRGIAPRTATSAPMTRRRRAIRCRAPNMPT